MADGRRRLLQFDSILSFVLYLVEGESGVCVAELVQKGPRLGHIGRVKGLLLADLLGRLLHWQSLHVGVVYSPPNYGSPLGPLAPPFRRGLGRGSLYRGRRLGSGSWPVGQQAPPAPAPFFLAAAGFFLTAGGRFTILGLFFFSGCTAGAAAAAAAAPAPAGSLMTTDDSDSPERRATLSINL